MNALIDILRARLGSGGMLTDPTDTEPYCSDWRGLYHGRTPAVLRPADTEAVAACVRACAEAGAGIVPMGGNTSMVGGAAVSENGHELVLSLSRMNRIRAIDPVDMTMTVEAGVTLKAAQDAAREAGCLLPLSISSEGSAQIGGVLATNAGGNNTVRYGNARELVLGLEAVMPDGTVFEGLRRLRKDNTGYALRQLLVGSEGTLGIITAAVLQLSPRPRQVEVALCAVASPEAALALFTAFRSADPSAIQAFEYMSGTGMGLVNRLIPDAALPLAEPAPHYVLVELASARDDDSLRTLLESVLGEALEEGRVLDAVVAESETQRLAIWKLREEHAEAQKRAGGNVKNDVSVPVSRVPELIARATEACERLIPGIRVAPFGHLGDGNIHFNLVQPDGADRVAFLARDHEIMDTVAAIVRDLDGSFSAEHGVGKLKPYMMPSWRGGAELETMRRIKHALDPKGIMNPGKVLPEASPPT
ncbi:FAD-binding oxidoreductase [Lichenicola cladoniae]|uniref:FAD-binding oxidoreductase n=1 Tax=Lichenicola cladoniae TaxID=1484109 RepID=A0A6M8HMQ7_9PROT|nr:FAD-binding oxidoreductase [Lichenicola cladoniae]NPD67092.1 FAD-binding oxidoreductase [Acetobacteraceae bacterium]QKE89632.1 FAD-binding oxidoreductase [Lichenicola cladoniae]